MTATQLTNRHRSMLRAIADGRGRVLAGCHGALTIDGLWCDFTATTVLTGEKLVRPAHLVATGQWAPAMLTPAGIEAMVDLSELAA